MNKKVAIITPANLPVPAVKGGAVESLIDNLCYENDKYKQLDIDIYSIYDDALNLKNSKSHTVYRYIKIPYIIKLFDRITYGFTRNILRKSSSSFRYFFQHIYFIIKVAKKISIYDYDDIVIENYAMMLWCLKLFNNFKKYKGRYYYHMHNVITHFFGCKEILLNSNKILAVSQYLIDTLPNDLRKNSTCKVLKNGIDTHSFKIKLTPEEEIKIREKYSLGNKKVVIFVGRFVPEKGIKELLKAWKKLNRDDCILLIVGGTFFKTDVKSDFEKSMFELAQKIGDSIKFTGYIDYKNIPKFYALANLIVIPSMWDDPAPLTILEALTVQKPLITTNSGGIPEYLNGNGIIVKRDSNIVDNLSQKISRVLDNEEKITMRKVNGIDIKDYYKDFIKCLE